MKYKNFSQKIWQQINTSISNIKSKEINPIAAFDADGTLWDTDLGETFFKFQIQNRLVNLPPNPWEYYLEFKNKNNDPRDAYLWLAQINKGQKLEDVRRWSEQSLKNISPFPFFEDMQKLVKTLKYEGVKVYIVTASVRWAVEPAAKLLGLEYESVIGVETKVKNGIITDNQSAIITYKQGKVDALKKKTYDKLPFLCAGNSIGDLYLLESSTDIKLTVRGPSQEGHHLQSEIELQEIAKQRNWLIHQF